ncbi:hypothetical protein HPB47_013999 [Ixodes persulcatus]|uniref:Uncharacterized protein n=1 Tax=Ixodes persulcatus TaxID=34615 RepID=A0AC60QX99_IXOPE|nr:hypothetical protein HPB47_013999 [Ixodes persulcatus]
MQEWEEQKQGTDVVDCVPLESYVKCELGNPLNQGTLEIFLRFNARSEADAETSLNFIISANTKPFPLCHCQQVFNHGPWTVPTLDVVVSWPYEAENEQKHGKYLLYMTQEPKVVGDGECRMLEGQVNPLGLKRRPAPASLSRSRSREKREVVITPEEVRLEGKTVRLVTMAETRAYPDASLYQKSEGVALWIIILAVCAGILLLLLVIFLLYKLGFFKRKRPAEGYSPAPTSDKDFNGSS